MRGSGCGVASRVDSQFTRAAPSRLAASRARGTAAAASTQTHSRPGAPPTSLPTPTLARKGQSSPPAMATLSRAMAPR
jgi:hypothetical protein